MKSIYKALADFQQECPVIHEGTKGYSYTYADLTTIFGVINPILAKNNLGFTQLINDNCVESRLFHTESGEVLKSVTTIPRDVTLKGMNEFQVMGSAITYIRRYALSAMLGIVTDKDADATGKQVKQNLLANTPKFKEVKGFLDTGNFTIAQVETKYILTPEVKSLLTK
jgi:hypothetical protein